MIDTNYIPYELLLAGYENLNWIDKLRWNYYEIKQESYGGNKGRFAGRIHFESNNKDSIYLNIDPEYAKKFIEVALPLFERATSEKIEIIREELGLNE